MLKNNLAERVEERKWK